MKVKDAVEACEYCGCEILDFNGKVIPVTKENCNDIYELQVESLSAKDSKVRIWTYKNMDTRDDL